MRRFFILIFLIISSNNGLTQTNLICNHSFENTNQNILNNINISDILYVSHFGSWDPTNSLFECWYTHKIDGDVSSNFDIEGVEYGFAPNLFPTANGTPGPFDNYIPLFSYFPNLPWTDLTSTQAPRALFPDPEPGSSHLKLQSLPNGKIGFDLAPPYTKFGDNVSAPNGTNYVGLVDIRNEQWSAGPNLITQLKYPLVKNVRYTFSMEYAKMNLIGQISQLEGWDKVVEGELKVWVCDSDLKHKQRIFKVKINNNNWVFDYENFVANKNSTHLYIEYNPIDAFQLFNAEKIAGVFIDNLKLYESCETPDNQCLNANYRRDLLDVKLQKVDLVDPNSYPEAGNNQYNNGYIKTIRATGLENVKRLEVKIYPITSSSPIKTIDIYYPESTWVWDGRTESGNYAPEGKYRAIINAVSNDCWHNTNVDEKNFKLERHFSTMSLFSSINQQDGNTIVGGLSNVHNLNIKIYNAASQLVYNFDLLNPPNQIGFSTTALNSYTNSNNAVISTGYYRLVLTASNNCDVKTFDFPSIGIFSTLPDASNNVIYNWSSVPKNDFACPFTRNYNHNYLAPMDCCEGNLFLQNVDIYNSWDVQILGNINIGPNVYFAPGVVNNLYSAQQIILVPDANGVIVNNETLLMPTTNLNCELCKVFVVDDHNEDSEESEIGVIQKPVDIIQSDKGITLFPNPVERNENIIVDMGSKKFDKDALQVALINGFGIESPMKIEFISQNRFIVKTSVEVPSGLYVLKIITKSEAFNIDVMIK